MKLYKKILIFSALALILIVLGYFFVGTAKQAEKIKWGVDFSIRQAEDFGLNWKETFLAILDDLGVKNLRVSAHWDLIESKEGTYDFSDLDWMIDEAGKRNVEIILAMGTKTPRWPECHIPQWAEGLKQNEQQKKILNLEKEIILKYQKTKNIKYWQVENEPFFPFGKCPMVSPAFVKEEVSLVKSVDSFNHPVVISDSGEGSLWFATAGIGDIVGITTYRRIWFKEIDAYFNFPLPPIFYSRRAQLIDKLFGKKVINVELQAEPWCQTPLWQCTFEEQNKTMNLEQFKKNVEFARKTGIDEFYLWGVEWWYWLKTDKQDDAIWQEASKVISG